MRIYQNVFILLFIWIGMNPSAHGFTLLSASDSYWKVSPITVSLDISTCGNTAEALSSVLDESIRIWNRVGTTSLTLKRVDSAGNILVACETLSSGVGGVTSVSSSGDTILSATMTIAVAANRVVAHELGHALGLGHSGSSIALMYYSTNISSELNLSQDDVDGITYLYPRDEPRKNLPFGCFQIRHEDQDFWSNGQAIFGLFLFGCFFIWRVLGRSAL